MSEKKEYGSKVEGALTVSQKARIERNRQRALLLKQSRLVKKADAASKYSQSYKRPVDTGAGFMLEQEEEEEGEPQEKRALVHREGAVLEGESAMCLECDKPFLESYLLTTFDHLVCDSCKDTDDKHALITRTEARERYLLKEEDLDKREPLLKCIARKNPRRHRFGVMRLYLDLQVQARAVEVWGSEEALEAEHERREAKRDTAKKKKYNKKMKELRMAVRSSLYQREDKTHHHEYGSETYDEEEDQYSKTCASCGHTLTYEKM